jgi:hypothetical protein
MVEWRRDGSILMTSLRTMAGQQGRDVTGEQDYVSASPRLTRSVSGPTSPLSV